MPAWPQPDERSLGGAPHPSWPARDADHLLVTGAQMAALEHQLFASGLPVEALMEKAALAVSRRLLKGSPTKPDLLGAAGVVVLVGPGHNGGDGLVVARELHLAGVPVRLWCPFERRKPLTERHWNHALWLGIPLQEHPPDPRDPDLWIDALFGNGQIKAPGEVIETLLAARDEAIAGPLLAIDGPTGLCFDTGQVLGRQAARADLTLCIGLWKQGLVQDAALRWVGRLERVDLGFPRTLLEQLPLEQPLGLGEPDGGRQDASAAPRARIDPAAGKYERGRLLVIAGSDTYRGAAHLALSGATSSGVGSLRALVPPSVADHLWMVMPHVVLEPRPLAEGGLERLDAVLVGPGLGPLSMIDGESAPREPWWDSLQMFPGLLVVDADGLNRIHPAWLRERVGPTWITPHGREFQRLWPDLDCLPPLEAATRAAETSGATVLLKGARSVIAAADGRRWQLMHACGDVARTGLGDGLAGYAAGMGARLRAMKGNNADASGLAVAALDHAIAGFLSKDGLGPGGASPLVVTEKLGHAPF
jgi:hydroxyethylthiazole kinase-like uncharacterized protein yjeF